MILFRLTWTYTTTRTIWGTPGYFDRTEECGRTFRTVEDAFDWIEEHAAKYRDFRFVSLTRI